MADVLGEHPAITEERNSLKHKLEILKHSSKVLMRDPDITSVIDLDERPPVREERKEMRESRSAAGHSDRGSERSFDSRGHPRQDPRGGDPRGTPQS
jgi:hypothetical protein